MIPFAVELDLPLNAVTTRFAHMGNIGSGKSYGAMKMAEGMLDAGAQIVVIDPVGVWYGLRILPNGRPSGYDLPIFGGLHGDLPLEATAGKMIADLIVDRKISAVLDTSMFESDADLHRFLADFGARFFFLKKSSRSPVHLFVEEAQEALPQNPQREEVKTLHVFQRMLKLGRNFGIGASLISQRPQDVNKKAINLSECLVVYQMNGSQERNQLKDWVVDKNLDVKLLDVLPTVPMGKPYIWSPRWLKVCAQYHVKKKKTADVSATPEVGEGKSYETKKLEPHELSELGEQIKATVERAKENDPALLKKKIAELERKIASHKPVEKIEPEKINVVSERDIQVVRDAVDCTEGTLKSITTAVSSFDLVLHELKGIHSRLAAMGHQPTKPWRPKVEPSRHAKELAPRMPRSEGNGEITGGARRMLIALAQRPDGMSAKQLGVRACLSSSSGTFGTYLSNLRKSGFVEGERDHIRITQEGANALGEYNPLPTGQQLLEYWLRDLGQSGAARMLQILAEKYPKEISADELFQLSNMSSTSGTAGTYLSKLRTLELVSGTRSALKASDELFD